MSSIFTTARDYLPGEFWRDQPNVAAAAYVRLLVPAPFELAAEIALSLAGVGGRYWPPVPAGDDDGPAQALAHHVAQLGDPAEPVVYALLRFDRDMLGDQLPQPQLELARVTDAGLVLLGQVRAVGTPADYQVRLVAAGDDQPVAAVDLADWEGQPAYK